MKFVSVFIVAVVVLAAVSEAHRHIYFRMNLDNGKPSKRDDFLYFDQRNDHFKKNDVSTFKQRYIVNDTLWKGNGYPIFVMLGGEGPLSVYELAGAFILNEKAAEYKALMVSVEHRFYGLSIPGDGTLSLKNLNLLSADQALADFAVFIEFIKEKYNATDSKIVTFGGSYSGSLSAWMRQKYPNLVDIAYASSAPVQAQLDFPEYFQVVTQSVGKVCATRIGEAFKVVDELLKTNKSKLVADFNVCSPLETELDEATFAESLSDAVAGVVQYSGDNNGFGRFWNISFMCDMIGTKGDAYQAYVQYVLYYNKIMGGECMSCNYTEGVEQLKNIDPKSEVASSRSWFYQTCVEYGYYQTIESSDVPFSQRVNLDLFLSMCKDVYGIDKANPGKSVNYTNMYYGGRDVRSDKIVFLNGSVDPWHALGLISDTPKPDEMPVCYINGTAHCADLYSSSPNDLDSLKQARIKAWKYMDTWIKETPVQSSSTTPKSSSNGASFMCPHILGMLVLFISFMFFM